MFPASETTLTHILVVSDPARLWFVLDVSEKDLGELKSGTLVQLATSSLGDERICSSPQGAYLCTPRTQGCCSA